MDEAAIKFLFDSSERKNVETENNVATQDQRYTEYTLREEKKASVVENAALGPSWYKHKHLKLTGCGNRKIHFRKM